MTLDPTALVGIITGALALLVGRRDVLRAFHHLGRIADALEGARVVVVHRAPAPSQDERTEELAAVGQ